MQIKCKSKGRIRGKNGEICDFFKIFAIFVASISFECQNAQNACYSATHSVTACFLAIGCKRAAEQGDALSLWNDDAPAKKALVAYVESVTKNGSADFIPVENRIATFDLDGTLFCETNPTYFDFQLFIHRILDDPNTHLARATKFFSAA